MSKKYLLLVDDEENILRALSRELEDWIAERHIELLFANNGKKALEILKEKGKETVLIVSDLRMPEMKGSELLLRVKEEYPFIVSILLTGYSEIEEIIKSIKAGIFSYILKPWDSDYLLSEITKAYEYAELQRSHHRILLQMQEELRWAGEMQRNLLRPNLPASEKVEFRVSYKPLVYCGGDYYDVITLSPDRYLILLGDVAGHGIRAAIITGILKAVIYPEYVRTSLTRAISPAHFLSWLNDRMNFELRRTTGILITFFAGILDLQSKVFQYANAGQCHPILVRHKKIYELPVAGSAIGYAQNINFSEQIVQIEEGDIISFFTDGLIEFKKDNDLIASISAKTIFEGVEYTQEYHKSILNRALEISESKGFTDDVTILTARIQG